MDDKKKTIAPSTTLPNYISTPNYIENYDSLDFLNEEIYRDCAHNLRCQSCTHWNGFICNAKHAVCDYIEAQTS